MNDLKMTVRQIQTLLQYVSHIMKKPIRVLVLVVYLLVIALLMA